MEAGGDVAANLSRLYDYIVRTLLTANLKSDAEQLDIADRCWPIWPRLADIHRPAGRQRVAVMARKTNLASQRPPEISMTSLTHISSPILEHYQEIAVTGEMLTAAQAGDWDTAMVHGQQYCELERLRHSEPSMPLDDAGRAMKYDQLVRILENDALTRDLAIPQLARLGELLGRMKRQQTLLSAYGYQAPGNMSVGPAALGNVLVQRLDAVLGTTMSAASANQVSGARPDAVSQPGSLEKPGQADGSPRDPARASRRARAVNAPPSSTPRPPPRWPWRARPGHQQRHHGFRAHHAGPHRPRDSLAAGAVPTQPRPCKGARHCGPRCIGRPPARCHGRAAAAASWRPAASPGAARQYARRTTAGRCANSAANVATVLNAIAGDPATAAGKTPGQTGATEGAPPPRTRPPPPRRVGAQGPAARAGPGPARSPADQRPVLRITPGRSGLRPR